MPIVIKELFSSDPLSEVLEKINFNFDQMVLAGGGPPGPIGPQGVPGIPGPQGERGDHWQAGATAPTMDHGPNFGDLKDYDFWLDNNGEVFYWDSGSTAWLSSGVNLTGPTGNVGATGGSLEFSYYHGKTGNLQSGLSGQSNYVPDVTIGPTTIPSGKTDFISPNNASKVGFFIGDPTWAYNYLNNFNILELTPNPAPPAASSQRLNPKITLIQTGIDFTGLGGLSIGAYGATSGSGTNIADFNGATGATTDGRNFFNAGFAINQSGPNYSHFFKAGTRSIDFELFAGDIYNTPTLGLTQTPNLRLLTTTGGSTIIAGVTGPRLTVSNALSRFNTDLAVGHASNPTLDTGSTFDNFGKGRSRGDFYIGNLDGSANSLGIGYARTIDGSSNLSLYTNGSTPTTPTFAINRSSGANGIATISQEGTGQLNIQSLGLGSFINLISSSTNGHIRFSNSSSNEIARIDTVNQRVGILTVSPQEALQVAGNIHVSGGDRTVFNRDANYLAFGTSNTERMRILSSGLVGINTTTPSDFLEVGNGNIAINDAIISSAGIGRGLKFENGTSAYSSINLYRGSASNNLGLSFQNSNAGTTQEAMRIHPNGFVSIAAPTYHQNPPYRVHIQGNEEVSFLIRSNLSVTNKRNDILFQRSNLSGAVSSSYPLGGLSFGGWDGTNWSTGWDGGAQLLVLPPYTWTPTSRPADMLFITTPAGATGAIERLRINSQGNVGIGTSSPSDKLHVVGSLTVSSNAGQTGPQISLVSNHTADTSNIINIVNSGTGEANLFVRTDSNAGISIINNANNGYKTFQVFGENDFSSNAMQGNQFRINTSTYNIGFAENGGNFQIGLTGGSTRPSVEMYGGGAGGAIFIRSNTNNSSAGLTSYYNQLSLQAYQNYSIITSTGVDTLYIACATNATATSSSGTNNTGQILMGGNSVGTEGGAFRINNADRTNVLGGGGIQTPYNMEVSGNSAFGYTLNQPVTTMQFTTVLNSKGVWLNGYTASGEAFLNPNPVQTLNSKVTVNGYIKVDGMFGTSDMRLKTEIGRFERGSALEKIMKLDPVLYQWNEKSSLEGKIELGLFAQEVKEIIPESVKIHKTQNFEDEHVLEYQSIFVTAIGAIKDQQRIIESQEETIKSLEEKISRIEKLLNI